MEVSLDCNLTHTIQKKRGLKGNYPPPPDCNNSENYTQETTFQFQKLYPIVIHTVLDKKVATPPPPGERERGGVKNVTNK